MGNTEKREKLYIAALAFTVIALAAAFVWVRKLTAGAEHGAAWHVRINEVLAANTHFPDENGRFCDFIELYNSADYPVELSGCQLGDGGKGKRYVFPAGTFIGPEEYLVISCGGDEGTAPFGISRSGGETLRFLSPRGVVIEELTTVETLLNHSMARFDGGWSVSPHPTPGAVNTLEASDISFFRPSVSPVRINEAASRNRLFPDGGGEYHDWIELYNTDNIPFELGGFTLSDNVSLEGYVFPEGAVIEANGYLVVWCGGEGALHAPFGLSKKGGETIVLRNPEGRVCDLVDTASCAVNGSLALGGDGVWRLTDRATPGFPNDDEGYNELWRSLSAGSDSVIISEIMASNLATLRDARGEFSDWVELCNVSGEAVDVGGWYLSDDPENPEKWKIPHLLIEPGGYKLIFCSGADGTFDGEIHTGFSLSASGESVVLTTDRGVTASRVDFSGVIQDSSVLMDGRTAAYPTPGFENTPEGYESFSSEHAPAGPLAIWEVMTGNTSVFPQAYGRCFDYAELKNVSAEPVRLSDYSITDNAAFPELFPLPDVTLEPGEFTVIFLSGRTELTTRSSVHAGFKLSSSGDRLYLFNRGGELSDFALLPELPRGTAYGRGEGKGGFFYMTPSPGEENASGSRFPAADKGEAAR